MSEDQQAEAEKRKRRILFTGFGLMTVFVIFCLIQSSMSIGLTLFALAIVCTPIVYTTLNLANKAGVSAEWKPEDKPAPTTPKKRKKR